MSLILMHFYFYVFFPQIFRNKQYKKLDKFCIIFDIFSLCQIHFDKLSPISILEEFFYLIKQILLA